ncbi:MAG TPA: hypothetical protein VJR92_05415 [Gemmatimonadaceae bacterium]|nr:hypothetical protein [Gemmatimonadaceae bacterium]
MADAADRAGRAAAARNIRARLAAGDFREGNRLVVEITNAVNTTTTDTITVRPNQTILFKPPVVGELALNGVLRSEVEAKVAEHVAKWYRTPTVRVTPLIRLGIIGSVLQAGYKDMSPTALITDIVNRAGGYSATADPDKIIVKRGTDIVWEASEVRIALTEGYSIDRFSLRDGDQIEVPQKQQRNWMTTVQFVIGTASLLVLLITQTR